MATPAWIGLGSNLGNRRGTLDAAQLALAETPGVVVRAVSSYRETAPVGGPAGQGAFLNAAAQLETTLGPLDLLDALQDIECKFGRVRVVRWGERTLDLDILVFGTSFLDTPRLKLPHPRLAVRRFVLAPLAEIAPKIVDTMTRRTIAASLAELDRCPRLVALEGPPGPIRSAVFRGLAEALPAIGIVEVEEGQIPGPEEDPDRMIASFERKADALHRDRWPTRAAWIVSDYCLHRDLGRIVGSIPRFNAHPDRTKARAEAFYAAIRRVQEAAGRSIGPTLAVALPGAGRDRRPFEAPFPVLRPESDRPDAIVAEVVATCRGIEGR